tara:strand:- start:6834 stop:7736 length:903 start_codon:yes stop_codon:yes gene_type:complete
MSDIQKYKLRSTGKKRNVNIQIEQDFFPVDNTEEVKERIDKITQLEINPIDDWEKTKYTLRCDEGSNIGDNLNEQAGCYTIQMHMWNNCDGSGCIPSMTTSWTESGIFSKQDVAYRSARFIGSYVRLSYFTTPHRETQKLVSYANIQLSENDNSFINLCKSEQGSFLYHWKSEAKLNMTDSRLYMKVEFFNSAKGVVHTLGRTFPVDSNDGNFYIDYWNEKFDYVTVLLDPATRTYRFETSWVDLDLIAWWNQYIISQGAGDPLPRLKNYLVENTYNNGCEMDLWDKRLNNLPIWPGIEY